MTSIPGATGDTDIEAVKNGIKNVECTVSSVYRELIKVNGKADKPEKPEEEDSGDEVEETTVASKLALFLI